MAYFEACQLSFGYKKNLVLQEVNFSLHQSQAVALLGENGVGKTTLSKLMIGLNQPRSGSILWKGRPVEEVPTHEIGRSVGYLFQNPSCQIFCATIKEELLFAARFRGNQSAEEEKKADRMIRRFSLEEARDVPTFQLSQGEKQRLALATILMNEPEFLILDEPTFGLDQERKDELTFYLKKIHQSGIGMMIISHDIKFVDSLCSRKLTVKNRRVYEVD